MSNDFTPEQAREQLAAIQSRILDTNRDRAVHAGATAAFGGISAFYMAAQSLALGWLGHTVLSAGFLAAWLLTVWWIEHAARTVPRRAKVWSRGGILGSFVLALTVVLPWLNYPAQSASNSWLIVAAGAAVAAAPALVAAAVIRWASK